MDLSIDIESLKQNVPTNHYSHYVIDRTIKIAKKSRNTDKFPMDYYVFWKSKNPECGYLEMLEIILQ